MSDHAERAKNTLRAVSRRAQDRSSGALFDLGLVTGSFDVQIASNFAFSFEAEFPTSGSGWQLLWNLRVIW